jgi:hypothetical protein
MCCDQHRPSRTSRRSNPQSNSEKDGSVKTISFPELVDIAKMRWRIERDYQDLKQEIGLGHYEGRGWRGFHHHGTLCIAAYGFLISERETIPPSGPRSAGMFAKPAVSRGYRPRGAAAPAPTAHPQLNCGLHVAMRPLINLSILASFCE